MNKKLLIILFVIAGVLASLYITFKVDPVTARYEVSLKEFHQNSVAVYIDTYFKKEFIPKLEEGPYKEKVTKLTGEILEIINKEVDPNLIYSGVDKVPQDELEAKTEKAMAGIEKMLTLVDQIEKDMPAEAKQAYNPKTVNDLRALYESVPSGNIGTVMTLRFLILFLIIVAAGATFIFIERKARETGEIKSTEVA
jgi:hypothetical protein